MTLYFDTDFAVFVGKDYLIISEKSDRTDLYKARLFHKINDTWKPRYFNAMPLQKSLEWAILMARLWPLDLADIPYVVTVGNQLITTGWEFLEKFKIPFNSTLKEYTIFDFPEVLEAWKYEDISVLGSQFRVYQP